MYARGQGCQCTVWDSALRRREDHTHEIAEQQHLPRQDGRVLQHAPENEPAFDQRVGCVRERIEVDRLNWRIALGDQTQTLAEAIAPGSSLNN